MDDLNLQKMAEELTSCVVCTNKYFEKDEDGIMRIPKVLDCTHTFCDKCLVKHLQQSNANRISPLSNFRCPTCRKIIYLPQKGVGAFPTDLKIKQIMELLQNIEVTSKAPSNRTKSFCQPCHFKGSEVEGNCFCLTCQKIFCNGCRKLHQKIMFFSNHSFFNLDDRRRTSRGSVDSGKECSLHSTDFEYTCSTCNKPLCCLCAMMPEHRGHKMARIVDAGAKEDENIYEDIQESTSSDGEFTVDEQLLKRKSLVSTLKQRMDDVLAETNLSDDGEIFKTCENNITKAYKEAQKHLKNHYDDLIKKLGENKCAFAGIISKKKEIQSTIKTAEKLLNDEEKSKKVDSKKFLELLPKLTAFDESSMTEANRYRCIFKADVHVRLGELVLESNDSTPLSTSRKRAPLPSPVADGSENAAKKMPTVSQGEESTTKSDKVNDLVKMEAISKALKSLLFKQQTKSNKIAEPSRYAVSNDMYQGLLHWHLDGLRGFEKVCFIENGEVLVAVNVTLGSVEKQLTAYRSSDCSRLEICLEDQNEPLNRIVNVYHCNDTKHMFLLGYRDSQGMVKKLKTSFSKKNMTCRLHCIETTKLASIKNPVALAANKRIIAILESDGLKVTAYNIKFEKVFEIPEGEFNKTNYITMDRCDRIFLSDRKRREVKVFKNNELVLKFSSTGPKGEELFPHGLVCVTKQNNMLVADQALDSISLYNSDGNLLEVVVEKIKKPTGISYSEGKHLLAVATDSGLSVFKL